MFFFELNTQYHHVVSIIMEHSHSHSHCYWFWLILAKFFFIINCEMNGNEMNGEKGTSQKSSKDPYMFLGVFFICLLVAILFSLVPIMLSSLAIHRPIFTWSNQTITKKKHDHQPYLWHANMNWFSFFAFNLKCEQRRKNNHSDSIWW